MQKQGFFDKFRSTFTNARPSVGVLQIVGIDKNGRRKVLEEQNLVVNNGRHILSQLLGGKKAPAQAQKYFITHMVMGDGVDPLNPSLPNPDSRFLASQRVKLEISSITFPSENSVKFVTLMDGETGNGFTFTEAGLVADNAPSESEKMFAIKHHGGIRKSEELLLEYNWTIVF